MPIDRTQSSNANALDHNQHGSSDSEAAALHHQVEHGDTLSRIAQRHNVSLLSLIHI